MGIILLNNFVFLCVVLGVPLWWIKRFNHEVPKGIHEVSQREKI
ncbi:hypothetical protein [Ignavibacterium sp.]|nr:hypothetical protein [Ignavibacterium sp.]